MQTTTRQQALKLIWDTRPADILLSREIEASCHAAAKTVEEYLDNVQRAASNLRSNEGVGIDVVHSSDEHLARETLLGRIDEERMARQKRFEGMLQEKYDALNDRQFQAIVRCRRCGSQDVSWDEKQTRSADEGATVFCVCTKCKLRWVIR